MRPFLRWAGGKRWLITTRPVAIPKDGRYVEPFLGGGAVFFSQEASRALLSDLNPYLINAYRWMKAAPSSLFEKTISHFDSHSSEYYYSVRGELGHLTLDDAAALIYLNRACFNGLFRVNLAGKFNVPIGTKLFPLRDREEFLAWSVKLQSAEILAADFEVIIDGCGSGDFLFVDPPYTVTHNGNGFIEYNEKIFSWDDQVRLAHSLSRAKSRGVEFLLTNADHDNVRALYSDGYQLESCERGSEMAGKASKRGLITELLVASSNSILLPSKLL